MRAHSLLFPVSCLFLISILLVPIAIEAQSKTAPTDPDGWNERLQIGPVAGLTTVWHTAPIETGVPLREALRFRVRVSQTAPVFWEGAREVERTRSHSVAEVQLDSVGQHTVRVTWKPSTGPERTESAVLRGIDTGIFPVRISPIRVSVDEVEIDPANPNASTMKYFFRGDSIAPLVEVGPDHFRTSVDRSLHLAVDVQPGELAPLVEWHLDGKPQRQLGSRVQMTVFVAREHAITAGGDAALRPEIRLDTYRVRITEETRDQPIRDGVPVTYRAETDPPGYEDEIAWLASTKYGTCSPDTGTGPEFTAVFEATVGETGRWLGIRASNSPLSLDGKDGSGLFQGSLVTEAVNVNLELDLTERNDCVGGTWAFTGTDGLVLSRGSIFGTRTGRRVSLPLSPLSDTVLEGQISPDGTSLSGSVQKDGSPIGTWDVLRCAGPNLIIELPGLDIFPPANLCSLAGSGNPLVVRNIGSETSSATTLRGRLDCVGPFVDIDTFTVQSLAPGETQDFVINIPPECTIIRVSLTVDPVLGECNTDNTVESLCVPPVP